MNVSQSISTRELLVFLYRYRTRLILAFAIPFALAVIVSFIPSPKYVASSDLVIRLGSEYVYQPEAGGAAGQAQQPLPFISDEIFKSEVSILQSDDLHLEVIKDIGLKNIYPDLFKRGLMAPINDFIGSVMIFLGLQEPSNSDDTERFMNSLGVQIFDKHFDVLLEKESAVIDLSYENKDSGIAVKTLESLLKHYLEKREKLYLEPRVEMAREQAEATHKKAIAAEQALDDFKRKHNLHSLVDERSALLVARGDVEKLGSEIVNPAVQNKMGYYDKQLDQLDQYEQQMDVLENDAKVAEDEYGLFQHKLNEAVAFEDMEHQRVSSVRIVQPPMVSAEPKRLQPMIILVGFVLSFLSVLMVAVVTEYSNNSFMTPERLERNLGLRVLAVLPHFE